VEEMTQNQNDIKKKKFRSDLEGDTWDKEEESKTKS